MLLPALIEQNLDEEAGRLLEDYQDDIDASWHYGRALWMFRRDSDSPAARAALQEAMRTNAHVVGYLLNPESIPLLADSFAFGSKEEAAHAADALLDAFDQTTGALTWIRTRTGHLRSRRKKR